MDTLYIILFHIKSNTKDDVIIKLIRIFRTHKKVKPTITHMKMILFRLICLKTCLLLIPVLYAQNNYRPGFIITVQKDTIYGEIDYRTDKMNAKRCVFQSQGNDTEPVTYHPFEILGYRPIYSPSSLRIQRLPKPGSPNRPGSFQPKGDDKNHKRISLCNVYQ